MKDDRQKSIRTIGIHLILILALLRFLVYPLHGAVAAQKIVFGEQKEAYLLKEAVLARQADKQSREAKAVSERDAEKSIFYSKNQSVSFIQAEVLEAIIAHAQEKGLTVLNFELLEATPGKSFTEIPVLIRLTGKPDLLADVLRMAGSQKRVLSFKNVEFLRSHPSLTLIMTVAAFRIEQ